MTPRIWNETFVKYIFSTYFLPVSDMLLNFFFSKYSHEDVFIDFQKERREERKKEGEKEREGKGMGEREREKYQRKKQY